MECFPVFRPVCSCLLLLESIKVRTAMALGYGTVSVGSVLKWRARSGWHAARRHWKDIYQRIFISYILSQNREKGYSPITFLSGICWGIWYPNFRDFKVLYHILSSILFRKNWQFWGTFALQNAFFVLLNTEINCEFPLNLIGNILKGPFSLFLT
jgi:hypothetical protein